MKRGVRIPLGYKVRHQHSHPKEAELIADLQKRLVPDAGGGSLR